MTSMNTSAVAGGDHNSCERIPKERIPKEAVMTYSLKNGSVPFILNCRRAAEWDIKLLLFLSHGLRILSILLEHLSFLEHLF